MSKSVDDRNYTEEWISVADLEIDPEVQRHHLDYNKIERIKRNFNPGAVGLITVSRRNQVTNIVLDGMHRKMVVAELTDGQGKMLARVFTDLTPAEEAQMFLDLNAGNQPSILDKFRMRLRAEDPVAMGIDQIAKAYQWSVTYGSGNGYLQAVKALERIYTKSERYRPVSEGYTNVLQLTLMTITRAWGNEREGVQSAILEGLSALIFEHQDLLDLDSLAKRMATDGRPRDLISDASRLAAMKKTKVSMAVAELLTDLYNKGRSRSQLPSWRRRS
jgi:hypothetical protein